MPKPLIVNPGDRFGRLTIIREVERRNKKRYFLCKCDCGTVKSFRLVALSVGKVKSCGCLRDEHNRIANLKHGMWNTRIYSIWHGMKQRCLNESCVTYEYYGRRGIELYKEWEEFEPFYKWAIENGYHNNLTIERIDVNGNYEPSNCKWITQTDQLNNTRRSKFVEYKGKVKNLKQWSEILNFNYKVLQKRLASGWTVERAFETPLLTKYSRKKP